MYALKTVCLSLLMFLTITGASASDDEASEDVVTVTKAADPGSQNNGMLFRQSTNVLLPLILSTTTSHTGKVEPRLSIKDLCHCALVCREWNRLSALDVSWKPHAEKVYRFETIGIETYNLSCTFLMLLNRPNHQKLLLVNRTIIQEELSILAKDLFRTKNCSTNLMLALELLGDTSVISTYLSETRNALAIENKKELTRILDEYIALGSQYAVSFKASILDLLIESVD